ncbi:PH domain-containing protein [Brevibacterium yomogidense]|uniref:PH domain-containing protein n=1 Tax=Brevibacterium yomogidense TaxID=946573 RepID=UPI0018DF6AE3|nr:PH domain-containing protein [Brevibacterium yomogidense]
MPEQPHHAPRAAAHGAPTGDSAGWRHVHRLTPVLRGGAGLLAALGAVVVILFQNLQSVLEDLVVEGLGGPGRDTSGFGVFRLLPTLIREHPIITLAVIGVLLVVLAVIIVCLWLSWRFTRFRIDSTGVYLRTGVLARRERSASHDRVQSVDISLPFIPRLLGLASLVFDVAGGSDSDITISYLKRSQAEALREEILGHLRSGRREGIPAHPQSPAHQQDTARAQGTAADAEVPGTSVGTATSATAPTPPDGHAPSTVPSDVPTAPLGQRLLTRRAQELQSHAAATVDDLSASLRDLLAPYRLNPTAGEEGRLLRVPFHRLLGSALLSTTVLVSAVFVVGLLAGIVVVGIFVSPRALVTTVFAVIPGVLALVGVLRSEMGLANFTVALTQDGLRVSHGLASTTNRIIPLDRIQAVKLRQPLLWRTAGWWRAEFTIASEGSDGDTQQNVLLPVGSVDDVMLMLGLCLPDPRPHGTDARSLVLAGMLGPAAGGPEAQVAEPFYRGRPRSSRWVDPVTWKRNAHALTGTLSLIRSGRLSRVLEFVPHARVQALTLSEGPVQRRLGVSTIALHISPGPIAPHFVHLPTAEAQHLFHQHAHVTRAARIELDAHTQGSTPERKASS